MNAYYEKFDDYYIVHLGVVSFRLPFVERFYGCSVEVSDELLDTLIDRYDNDCLVWKYEGVELDEGMVEELLVELGCGVGELFDYLSLCVKD